jgi:hypothetical protein
VALLACCVACGRRTTATANPTTNATTNPTAPLPTPCGALDCAQYESAQAAFAAAVATKPLVLAIGEAHAPHGATAPSSAKHFADELLPTVADRSSDLLVELMTPPKGCMDAAEEVRKKQAPATSRQAETNQNEYVAMGERARALGIVPDMLRPSCADMNAVRLAGDDAIGASLDMIARLTRAQAKRMVDRDARSDADAGKMIVLYGGMLHNDLSPAPEMVRYSYGPDLDAYVGGRFVAVDLVVPEFIGDDATWTSLPWRAHYDKERLGAKSTLYRIGEKSYVLVFPLARAATHDG